MLEAGRVKCVDVLATHEAPWRWGLRVQKYSIFDAFGKAKLCLMKRFLFLTYL